MAIRFPETYPEARAQFRDLAAGVRGIWHSVVLEARPLEGFPDLTVDWLYAVPSEARRQLLVATTGLHGIEGYVGMGALQLLMQEFLPRFDPRVTGVLLIHALNPWGMMHRQKTNAANVDLNRNFVLGEAYPTDFNADYAALHALFAPSQPVRQRDLGLPRFFLTLVRALRQFPAARVQEAFLIGQYRHADGIYYGGTTLAEELQLLLQLLRPRLDEYERVTYLEMHTGYGPRYQMSLVHSPQEPRNNHELAMQFDYPLVVRTEPGAFYAIRGDVVDGLISLARSEAPRTRFYGATFEFGTLGDSLFSKTRSMQAMALANQLRHYGAASVSVREEVQRRFEALYAPRATSWQEKASADAQRAFEGILRAEGFL
ncbi:MAG: hypothetical protein BWY63_01347 [Chloroflexi bacterium ADurb.Bin360]|nr:MAG: hypothetical protein BWY63_01347 [Chloroflexi bacterium ADurb.Bin360]